MAYYEDTEEARKWRQSQTAYSPQPLASQAAPGAGYGATPTTTTPTTRTANPTVPTPTISFNSPTTPSSTTPTTTPAASTYDPFEAFRLANQSGTSEDILRKAYTTFTGRDADAEGLKAHLANPGGLHAAVRTIYDSGEGEKYRTANPNNFLDPSKAGPIVGPDGQPVTPAADATAPNPANVTPQIFQGFTPKYAMEGFDFAREQNTGKSAKDAFAYLSNNAPPPPINDKAKLGAWFQQYVAPGMNALGHKILSVNGDSFTFSNWQGTFTVDFGRGAGAEGGALAWQVDDGSAKASNGAYKPQQVVPAGTPAGAQTVTAGIPAPTDPMSAAVTYRRPYEGYVEPQQQQSQI